MEKREISGALPQGVTPEMVAGWKERYGQEKVKVASLPIDDDATAHMDVVIRIPGRKEMSEFERWADKNPDKAKEILVNSCVLSSKDVVKADDGLFFAAVDAIAKVMPIRTATIKNL